MTTEEILNKFVTHDFEVKDGKFVITVMVDSNRDGEPVVELVAKLDLLEVPEELLNLIKK